MSRDRDILVVGHGGREIPLRPAVLMEQYTAPRLAVDHQEVGRATRPRAQVLIDYEAPILARYLAERLRQRRRWLPLLVATVSTLALTAALGGLED